MDSGIHPMGYPDFLLVKLRLRIPIVSGIPDCLNCTSDSKAFGSGFHKPIPRIPYSSGKNFPDLGLRIPLHGVTHGFDVTRIWQKIFGWLDLR